MKYIIHEKNRLVGYIPILAFNNLKDAMEYKKYSDDLRLHFLNLTPAEEKIFLIENGVLIEESKSGKFSACFNSK